MLERNLWLCMSFLRIGCGGMFYLRNYAFCFLTNINHCFIALWYSWVLCLFSTQAQLLPKMRSVSLNFMTKFPSTAWRGSFHPDNTFTSVPLPVLNRLKIHWWHCAVLVRMIFSAVSILYLLIHSCIPFILTNLQFPPTIQPRWVRNGVRHYSS